MSEEKKGFEPLSKGALQDITGGVPLPYEKPEIIYLVEVIYTCSAGDFCTTGIGKTCDFGGSCTNGFIDK